MKDIQTLIIRRILLRVTWYNPSLILYLFILCQSYIPNYLNTNKLWKNVSAV